jgi:hypothetical protein
MRAAKARASYLNRKWEKRPSISIVSNRFVTDYRFLPQCMHEREVILRQTVAASQPPISVECWSTDPADNRACTGHLKCHE